MRIWLASFVVSSGLAVAATYMASANVSEVRKVPTRDGSGRELIVRVMKPEGAGPFPLAIVNHGSPGNPERRKSMELPTYKILSEYLLAKGYAVAMPLRRGYGEVGGAWNERYGRCDDADFVSGGLETAVDIETVLDTLKTDPEIKPRGILVLGQSAGGWGTLALASKDRPDIAGYVNFSGGRGGRKAGLANNNCMPDRLVKGAATYGARARGPTLWLYTENDSYFAPQLARDMNAAFMSAGGKSRMEVFPPVGRDGHGFVHMRNAASMWQPVLARFIAELN